MPQVTHSVVDPISGDPVGVTTVEVRVVAPDPTSKVYRASDGFELAPVETLNLTPNGSGVYPSTWSVELPSQSALLPAGSRYDIRQTFVGDDPRSPRSAVPVVVPDGAGPFRLVDLLANPASSIGAVVAGVTPAGVYDAGTTYGVRQIVTHEGSSYVARATTTGVTPGTDANVWQLVAAKGDTGPAGTGDGFSGDASEITTGTLADARIPATITRDTEVQAAIDALIDGAPGTRDTLNEIATALAADEGALAALTSTVASKADVTYVDTADQALDTRVDAVETKSQGNLELINSAYGELSAHDGRLDALEGQIGNLAIVTLTEAQYTALVTKDPNTLYLRTA